MLQEDANTHIITLTVIDTHADTNNKSTHT